MTDHTLGGRYALAAVVDRTADGATMHEATERSNGRAVTITKVPGASADRVDFAGTVEHRHLLPVHEAGPIGDGDRTATATTAGAAVDSFVVSDPYGAADLTDSTGQLKIYDPSFVESIVRQLAAALDALAARELVHLGVEPAAVHFDASIHPADPGTIRLGRLHRLVPSGTVDVTPLSAASFVAPELEERPPPKRPAAPSGGDSALEPPAPPQTATPAADRWALGALAYTLLGGRAPFPISEAMGATEASSVRAAKWAGELQPLETVRPSERRQVPKAVDAVLATMMAPDPADRPTSAAWFAEAFAQAWRSPADGEEPEGPDEEPKQSLGQRLAVAGVVALLLLVTTGFWLVSRSDDPATLNAVELPSTYGFVRAPLSDGCSQPGAADARFGDAEDSLRCSSGGVASEIQLFRFGSVDDADAAAARLLDQRIGSLTTCSQPPLVPDPTRPSALACFLPADGGAQLAWRVRGRPVLAIATSSGGDTAALEVWLRQVAPELIEEKL